MKKVLSIILILLITINLFGCQSKENKNQELIDAVIGNNLDDVQKLIKSGADVNCINKHTIGRCPNFSPLKIALTKFDNNAKIIGKLIDSGADINEIDEEDGENFLYRTIVLNQLDKFKLLISKGIDINVQNNRGETPLMVTAIYGREEMYNLLLKSGADSSLKDYKGKTAEDMSEYREQRDKEMEEYKAKKKDPQIGMTANEVKKSTWGTPKKINKTTTKYKVREQWVYDGYKYIYLDNGIVTAIQE